MPERSHTNQTLKFTDQAFQQEPSGAGGALSIEDGNLTLSRGEIIVENCMAKRGQVFGACD